MAKQILDANTFNNGSAEEKLAYIESLFSKEYQLFTKHIDDMATYEKKSEQQMANLKTAIYEKMYAQESAQHKQHLSQLNELKKKQQALIDQQLIGIKTTYEADIKRLEATIAEENKLQQQRLESEDVVDRVKKIAEIRERNHYKTLTVAQKIYHQQQIQQHNQTEKLKAQAALQDLIDIKKVEGLKGEQLEDWIQSNEEIKSVKEQIKQLDQSSATAKEAEFRLDMAREAVQEKQLKRYKLRQKYEKQSLKDEAKLVAYTVKHSTVSKDSLRTDKEKQKIAEKAAKLDEKAEKRKRKISSDYRKDSIATKKEQLAKLIADPNADPQIIKSTQKQLDNLLKEDQTAQAVESAQKHNAEIGKHAANAIYNGVMNAMNKVDQSINSIYGNQSIGMARLYGQDIDYKKSIRNVSSTLGLSPIVSQTKMVENINKAIDIGIAYNLELRSFLATVTDDVQKTFDAFDSNLLRVIRLQQADTTALRMGMEKQINEFLNGTFKDTSYLNDVFDSVSGAIVEANSQLSRDQSIAFEGTLQKWMGSLYSLGMSSTAITNIAQGINMLSTGNIEGLSGNDQMTNLLAMVANRTGLPYAQMLQKGVTGDNLNKLMQSMVEYLKQIAEGTTENKVLMSSYGNVFGMSVSDLRAISNMTQQDISTIYDTEINSSTSDSTLASSINRIYQNKHLSQMVDTLFDNATTSMSTAIGGNIVSYSMWKAVNLLEQLTGGIEIPGVLGIGTGIIPNTSIERLIKGGMMGMGLLTQIVSQIGKGIANSGKSNYEIWGFDEYTSRGKGYAGVKGVNQGLQESEVIGFKGNLNGSDMENDTLDSFSKDQEEKSKRTNGKNKTDIKIEDLFKGLFGDEVPTTSLFSVVSSINTYVKDISELQKASTGLTQTIGSLTWDIEKAKNNQDQAEKLALNVRLESVSDIAKTTLSELLITAFMQSFAGVSSTNGQNVDISNIESMGSKLTTVITELRNISGETDGIQSILQYLQQRNI